MTAACITWQFPEEQGHELVLTKDVTIIGRGRDCDITILDERISRHHTEIYFDGETHLVSDLGSFNGTYLNGEVLGDTRPLKDGDQLRIGPVRLRFKLASASEDADAPRSTLVVPESSSKASLVIHDGTQFKLNKEKTTIGRGQGWDICLHDRAVSRPHAEITQSKDGFVLTDLSSANGTLVNGQLITEPKPLKDGDTVLFGEHPLVFRIEKHE